MESVFKVGLTVNATHLLSNHDSRSTVVRTPDARDSEAIPHTLEVATTACLFQLLLVDDVGVVVIPGGDDGMGAQFIHRVKALRKVAMLHKPSGRFRAEVNANHEQKGRNKGRSQLKAPGNVSSSLHDDVCTEAEEDACDDPELPKHDQSATDPVRCHFGGVDWYGSVLSTCKREEKRVSEFRLHLRVGLDHL